MKDDLQGQILRGQVLQGQVLQGQVLQGQVLRRDLFGLTVAGVGVVATGWMLPGSAAATPVDLNQKRRARYQPDSPEVRNFYRVNSYPGAR